MPALAALVHDVQVGSALEYLCMFACMGYDTMA